MTVRTRVEQKKCRVEGCQRPKLKRDSLCAGHRSRLSRYGDVMADVPLRAWSRGRVDGTCRVEGCEKPRLKHRSLCAAHYVRLYKKGDLREDVPIKARAPDGTPYVTSSGYLRQRLQGHPTAPSGGKVLVHRVVLHDALEGANAPCHWCSRPLRWDAPFGPDFLCVDHLDGVRTNNDVANLVPACRDCNTYRAKAGNPVDWTPDGPIP